MKKLRAISILLVFITFLFIFQINVYCMPKEEMKLASDLTVDDIMSDADKFISNGEASYNINETELGNTSDFLYNLLLGVGIIVAVGVGIALGIKYMVGSLEEKADLKQALLGYAISCLVIFGAFGIWRLAVNIFSSM